MDDPGFVGGGERERHLRHNGTHPLDRQDSGFTQLGRQGLTLDEFHDEIYQPVGGNA